MVSKAVVTAPHYHCIMMAHMGHWLGLRRQIAPCQWVTLHLLAQLRAGRPQRPGVQARPEAAASRPNLAKLREHAEMLLFCMSRENLTQGT